jgi:TolA-binding protein
MTDPLPFELQSARSALLRLTPEPFAKERIIREISRPKARNFRRTYRVLWVFGFMTAASAAFAIGSSLPLKIVTLGIFDEPSTRVVASPSLRPNAKSRTRDATAPSKLSGNPSVELLPSLTASANAPSPPPRATSEEKRPLVERDIELRLQVTEYRSALTLIQTNPVTALEAFQIHRRKWPNSPIRQEVDYRIVQALTTLGRKREAADEAKLFVKTYPTIAQASKLRKLYEIPPADETDVN